MHSINHPAGACSSVTVVVPCDTGQSALNYFVEAKPQIFTKHAMFYERKNANCGHKKAQHYELGKKYVEFEITYSRLVLSQEASCSKDVPIIIPDLPYNNFTKIPATADQLNTTLHSP